MTRPEKKVKRSTVTRRSSDSFSDSDACGVRKLVQSRPACGCSPTRTRRANTGSTAWGKTCRSSRRLGAARLDSPWWPRTPATSGKSFKNRLETRYSREVVDHTKNKARQNVGPYSYSSESRPRGCGTCLLLVVGRLHDQVIDDAVGFVDVPEGAIAQTAYGRIILFAGNIVVRFVEQFQSAVIAAGAVHMRIDRRMIVQILAIVNRSALDLSKGFVDLVNGMLFFLVHVMSGSQVLQVSARMPQVGERVQVGGMPSRLVGEA